MFDKERLREVMNILNLNQVKLSKKTGISRVSISNYLSGKQIPIEKNIILLSKVLGVNKDWLLGNDGEIFINDTVENNKHFAIGKKKEINLLVSKLEDINAHEIYMIRNHISLISQIKNNSDYGIIELFTKMNHRGKEEIQSKIKDMLTQDIYTQKKMSITASGFKDDDIYHCFIVFDEYSRKYFKLERVYNIDIFDNHEDEELYVWLEDIIMIELSNEIFPHSGLTKELEDELEDCLEDTIIEFKGYLLTDCTVETYFPDSFL